MLTNECSACDKTYNQLERDIFALIIFGILSSAIAGFLVYAITSSSS